MLVKKNYLNQLDKFKFKKVFYFIGTPLHLITHNMEPNRKDWKLKKNLNLSDMNDHNQKQMLKEKVMLYTKKSFDQIINSPSIDIE